ncbi:hypothetical protein ONZ45_g2220 [Pleurotus djamor]|nr:hypothetical protein ONZ45_g2220 [Pleurotus djamor]
MTTIPNELLLAIFREFHLTTLINGRAVCRKWHDLLPLAEIHPIRRALLDLYNQIITEPWFLDGRPWVLKNLTSFDRQGFLDALLAQYNYLPEEFRIWLLEWPAKAVYYGFWPGLPAYTYDLVGPGIPARWLDVWNFMDPSKPTIRTVNVIRLDVDPDFDLDPAVDMTQTYFIQPLPGLPVLMERNENTTWLMLDGKYRDQVVKTFESDHEFREDDEADQRLKSWVGHLRSLVTYLRYLHELGVKQRVPIILSKGLPSKMAKLSSSCTPWVSSEHTPYLRSVYYVSDDDRDDEEDEENVESE